MRKAALFFLVVVALILVAACGDIPTAALPQPKTEPTAPATAQPTAGPKATWPAEAQPLLDLALSTAARQANTGTADVEVVKVEEVQWPDGCLGCPAPGQMCTDVIVPGYRIVLRVGGVEYEFRTDKKGTVILCQPSTQPRDWGPAQPLVDVVVADLAQRLGIPQDQIQVVQVSEKEWPDSSIGCPQPGHGYLMVITPGYQIILQAGSQQYDYHTDLKTNFVLCEKESSL